MISIRQTASNSSREKLLSSEPIVCERYFCVRFGTALIAMYILHPALDSLDSFLDTRKSFAHFKSVAKSASRERSAAAYSEQSDAQKALNLRL